MADLQQVVGIDGIRKPETASIIASCIGKTIQDVMADEFELDNEVFVGALIFVFNDGSRLTLYDGGQQCCEFRFMTIESERPLSRYQGSTLQRVEFRVVEDDPDRWPKEYNDAHDVAFLVVTTSNGEIAVANHNWHNGYYCGFDLIAELETSGAHSGV